MVNFYPGFLLPEGAARYKDVFQVLRDMRARHPDDRDFQTAMRQWYKEHPIPRGNIHHVVDHIEHIVKTAGVDHVALAPTTMASRRHRCSWKTCSCYPLITQELLNRGYKKEDILKILGGNVLRVLRKAEEVAKEMKPG